MPPTDRTDSAASALLAEVVRSGFVEGVHRGSVVALGSEGAQLWRLGDPERPVFPRSCLKPLQAVGMLRAGLDLDGELLTLACASHSGEPFHLAGVRRLLAQAGLDESALQTPPDLPLDDQERARLVAAGTAPAPIFMNCSGKHAAMLATCVAAGWPTATYRDADHPLQQALCAATEELAGEPVTAVGVDGCGAPVFAFSLTGLARSFQRLALADSSTAEGRVAAAMRAHPTWLGGTRRDVSDLVAGVPGLVAKDGAEAVYVAALPDGRAVALKVDDGSPRARPLVMAAALRRLGVDAPVLAGQATVPLFGGGERVGDVRPVF